jgi:hypothetical protein
MSAAAAARTRRQQVEADKEIFEAELHSLVCFSVFLGCFYVILRSYLCVLQFDHAFNYALIFFDIALFTLNFPSVSMCLSVLSLLRRSPLRTKSESASRWSSSRLAITSGFKTTTFV